MISEEKRQRLIIRQSCLKCAVELTKNSWDLDRIRSLTQDLEKIVFEVLE